MFEGNWWIWLRDTNFNLKIRIYIHEVIFNNFFYKTCRPIFWLVSWFNFINFIKLGPLFDKKIYILVIQTWAITWFLKFSITVWIYQIQFLITKLNFTCLLLHFLNIILRFTGIWTILLTAIIKINSKRIAILICTTLGRILMKTKIMFHNIIKLIFFQYAFALWILAWYWLWH